MTQSLGHATTARHQITQYPELEEGISLLCQDVGYGRVTESQARLRIAEMVFTSGIIQSTISRYLRLAGGPWHLYEDLVMAAEDRVYRSITGELLRENMRPVDPESNVLLDLEVVRGGSSAVGFIRQGIVQNISAMMRGINRGPGRSVVFTALSRGDSDTLGGRWPEDWLLAGSSGVEGDLSDVAAYEAMELYAGAARRRRGVGRVVAQARAVSDFYQVPLAARPLRVEVRRRLLSIFEGNAGAAFDSLVRARDDGFASCVGAASVWAHYDFDTAGVLLDSPRAREVAHALAVAGVSPVPTRDAFFVKEATRVLTSLFRDHGAPVSMVRPLLRSFAADELVVSHRGGGQVSGQWVEMARVLKGVYPGLLGGRVWQVRQRLFEVVGADCAASLAPVVSGD